MPTSQDVLTAIGPLLPDIAAAAPDVDRTGVIPPEIMTALADAGVFALLQPAGFGGVQADPNDFLAIIAAIAAACTSTGWTAAMLAVNAWHFALFDPRAQHDVWGTDPGALISASYAPTGRLQRTADEFRLSGRWSRCTGIRHAAWTIVGALVVGADGAAEDFTVALVPRSDYAIEPTWNGLGLKGIGADDIVVSGAVVPGYRTFGFVSGDQRPGLDPLYRLPQPSLYNHAGTAPIVGAAVGLLAAHQPDHAAPLSPAALASADLELSVLQMQRNLTELLDCARAGDAPSTELMLRTRRDQVVAFARARQAIGFCVRQPGDGDFDARCERVWRDTQTAHMHVSNDVDRVLSVVGQAEFGVQVDEFML